MNSEWLEIAVPFVSAFEGCEKRGKDDGLIYPYYDSFGKVWTRGYGRCYGIGEESAAITAAEAKEELATGLQEYALGCIRLAPRLVDYPEKLAAVTSWAWNCGVGAFRVSRLRRAINEERWEDAAQHILTPRTAWGVLLKGLARRRDAEAALFMSR